MFKAEIIKLFKSKISYIFLFILFAFILYGVIDFNNNYTFTIYHSGYGIAKYDSKEQLLKFKTDAETIIVELEEELNDETLTEGQRDAIEDSIYEYNKRIRIYNYLIDNDISYTDYMDFTGTCLRAEDNAFSALYWIYDVLYYILPFVLSLFAIYIFSTDFHKGTYKFLYSTNVSRTKIIKNKYFVILFTSVIISLICFLASLIISLNFGSPQGKVIFVNNDSIFSLNYFSFYLLSSLDILFRTISLVSVIYGITLISKYAYIPLIFAAVILIINIFAVFNGNTLLLLLDDGLYALYLYGNSKNYYLIIYVLIFLLIPLITSVLGVKKFKTVDLK